MSYIEDLSSPESLQRFAAAFYNPGLAETRSSKAMKNRVGLISAHMVKQWKEHEDAMANTNRLFNQLLDDLNDVCDCFRQAFTERNIPASRVFCEIDADRSVGILNVLWNALSFTSRGNTKPLALYRPGRSPIFTGRIVALHGDFQDMASDLQDQEYPDILQFEIASLFVPADINAPAVMRVRHLGDQEQFIHQADAPRLFLLKTIEMICGGGGFHEKEF